MIGYWNDNFKKLTLEQLEEKINFFEIPKSNQLFKAFNRTKRAGGVNATMRVALMVIFIVSNVVGAANAVATIDATMYSAPSPASVSANDQKNTVFKVGNDLSSITLPRTIGIYGVHTIIMILITIVLSRRTSSLSKIVIGRFGIVCFFHFGSFC